MLLTFYLFAHKQCLIDYCDIYTCTHIQKYSNCQRVYDKNYFSCEIMRFRNEILVVLIKSRISDIDNIANWLVYHGNVSKEVNFIDSEEIIESDRHIGIHANIEALAFYFFSNESCSLLVFLSLEFHKYYVMPINNLSMLFSCFTANYFMWNKTKQLIFLFLLELWTLPCQHLYWCLSQVPFVRSLCKL